jgi:CO dehydrogenase/acetyl-CoA synthase beta subunit
MKIFNDVYKRNVRLTDERQKHFVSDHPEMKGQIEKLKQTLHNLEKAVRSKTDSQVELFYHHYDSTSVTRKYLCVVVKSVIGDAFIVTVYFTDSIKKGEILWEKK